MRGVGRDLIRGGHYGQRSCEPHQKAEHMAAPTNAAKREKRSCQPGAVHTWHNSDMPPWSLYVRCWGAERKTYARIEFFGLLTQLRRRAQTQKAAQVPGCRTGCR